jgi:hypothetical protein
MKTSGITAALPARTWAEPKTFYVEKVGLQALESRFLTARDGQVGLAEYDTSETGQRQFYTAVLSAEPSALS